MSVIVIRKSKDYVYSIWVYEVLVYEEFIIEALSIGPRVLIDEVGFVGKGMSRIMNFDKLQWV